MAFEPKVDLAFKTGTARSKLTRCMCFCKGSSLFEDDIDESSFMAAFRLPLRNLHKQGLRNIRTHSRNLKIMTLCEGCVCQFDLSNAAAAHGQEQSGTRPFHYPNVKHN